MLALLNPYIILVVLGVFTATSIYYRVANWWSNQAAISAWAKAVQDRDNAAQIKEEILEEAAKARAKSDERIRILEQALTEAQMSLMEAGGGSCRWSEDERRLLNAPGLPATPKK